ncbi:MAG: DNA polymerase III subunit delta' [Actinomycetes bacterium]
MWNELIGQEFSVKTLQQASLDSKSALTGKVVSGFSQAWLITGPPGSGRSTAARLFAATLQCEANGCGKCVSCISVKNGTHPDVHVITPTGLSYGIDDTKDLVREAAMLPSLGQWNIIILEDADRLTTEAGNALLKAIEEPAKLTMWILCAPSSKDVLITIKSRCRIVSLRTPPAEEIAELLIKRDGIDKAMAHFAAHASLGHVGRAKLLATDEQVRERRSLVLQVPFELKDLPSCFAAAQRLVDAATEDADIATDEMDEKELDNLLRAYGQGAEGVSKTKVQRLASSAKKELEDGQKKRYKRITRDRLDLTLQELAAFYRDVLVLQTGADLELFHTEMKGSLQRFADSSSINSSIKRLDAVEATRRMLNSEAAPLLVLESLTVQLARA